MMMALIGLRIGSVVKWQSKPKKHDVENAMDGGAGRGYQSPGERDLRFLRTMIVLLGMQSWICEAWARS